MVEKSQALKASVLLQDCGQLYAKKPHLIHQPGTHPEVVGENRWYRIAVGQRAHFWEFSAPTVD
jgi:hypothetical protein